MDSVHERLAALYHDPATGLASKAALYRAARLAGIAATHAQVKSFLDSQETAQRFKPSGVKHYYPLTQYEAPFARTQIDLLDLSNEAPRGNRGYKWIFCAIDTLSRFAYAIPMKSKSEAECLRAFRVVLGSLQNDFHVAYHIRRLDSDVESAFRSRAFKELCTEHGITQNMVADPTHRATSYVERFNRTLRMLIERYKVSADSNNWVDVLPKLLLNYNDRIHSSLGTTPRQALTNPNLSIQSAYRASQKVARAEKLSLHSQELPVGAHVRVLVNKTAFDKGTAPQWSKQIHTIERVSKDGFHVSDRVNPLRKYHLLRVVSPVARAEQEPARDSNRTRRPKWPRIELNAE